MSPHALIPRLSRRQMLSVLATLPLVSGSLLNPNAASAQGTPSGNSLPSWNDGATKQSILKFVAAVTREGSSDFVPPAERIATFDNDGSLWVEQPRYTQLTFALDRVRLRHPCIQNGRTRSRSRRSLRTTWGRSPKSAIKV